MTDSQRFHSLGQAVGLYNHRHPSKPISAAASGNVFGAPHAVPMTLRHVWPKMLADDEIRALIEQSEYETLRSVAPANASYYLGYYLGLSGRSVSLGQLAETRGGRLKAARERAGLSAAQLAAKLSISPERINNIEAGRCNVSGDWLWLAAGAIGCRGSELDPSLADVVPETA